MTKLASGYAIGCVESNELSSKEFALVKKKLIVMQLKTSTHSKRYITRTFITQKTIMVVIAKEIPHTAHTGVTVGKKHLGELKNLLNAIQ